MGGWGGARARSPAVDSYTWQVHIQQVFPVKNISRFAKRLGNRYAQALRQANRKVNSCFCNGLTTRRAARCAARNYRGITTQMRQAATREELGEIHARPAFRPSHPGLLHKAMREERARRALEEASL